MNAQQALRSPLIPAVVLTLILLAAGGFAVFIFAVGAPNHVPSSPWPTRADPLNVVSALHSTINSNDVNALLELFADDAVLIDNGSVLDGRNQIRDWALNSELIAGLHLTMLHAEMNGTKMIWLDTAYNGPEGQSRKYILRWEARIEDGKIQSLAILPRHFPDGK